MYQAFSGDFFPQQIGDLVWAEMVCRHESFWDQFRDEHGRLSEDDDYCYRENGPDGVEHEAELECFADSDPSWITPSLVL